MAWTSNNTGPYSSSNVQPLIPDIFVFSEEVADDADKSWVASTDGDGTDLYELIGMRVELISTVVVGSRQVVLEIQDTDSDVVHSFPAHVTQAASLTYNYEFAAGVVNDTIGTTQIEYMMPNLVLQPGETLRVYDSATIDSAPVAAQGTLTLDTIPTGAVKSEGTLTLDTIPTDADTMTVDGRVYTWEDSLTNVDGNIYTGGSLAQAKLNLVAAFDLSGTAGVDYATAMTAHATVTIAAFSVNDAVLTAVAPGTAGNTIVTTETYTPAGNVFDAATLGTTTAGVDGDTMTVDARVYTWQDDLTNADGNVFTGGSLAQAKLNIVAAFDLSGTPGTDYATAMTAHATVTMAAFIADDAILTAVTAGTAGNSIVTTETYTPVGNIFDAATLGTTTAGTGGDDMVIHARFKRWLR